MSLADWAYIATIAGSVVALTGGIYGSLLLINKLRNKRIERNYRQYTGEWNNTREILADHYSHYVSLQLFYNHGKVEGTLNIRQGKHDATWKKLNITGKRRFSTLHCVAKASTDDRKNIDGEIRLLRKNGHFDWSLRKGNAAHFPLKTELYRTLPTLI
jgi:hypothetical protein